MAKFTFDDKTTFELEDGERVFYAQTANKNVSTTTRMDEPDGCLISLLNLVTIGFYKMLKTKFWLANIAITDRRVVTVPSTMNKPKKLATCQAESMRYTDMMDVRIIKEDKDYSKIQGKFVIKNVNDNGINHQFVILTKKTLGEALSIVGSMISSTVARNSQLTVDVMKGWSLQRHQSSYDSGDKTFNQAQAAYNKDAAFYDSLLADTKNVDTSKASHMELRDYMVTLILTCLEHSHKQ